MIVHLENVLDATAVAEIVAVARGAEFVAGGETAQGSAAAVKHNLQLPAGGAAEEAAGATLLARLRVHPAFELATLPVNISAPRFSRYEVGMAYGDHLDAPLMGRPERLRTDIAVTVFLVAPETYGGGELVIDTDYGIERCKGGLGDCVVYPASTFHRVDPVTSGVRFVAVFWIQSAVRDPGQRKIIFDLGRATEFLDRAERLAGVASVIRRSQNNLMRMWADV
jgi:PKHD-type hydroxylase